MINTQGITRIDCLRQAVGRPRIFMQGPQAIQAHTASETGPASPETPSSDRLADFSQSPARGIQTRTNSSVAAIGQHIHSWSLEAITGRPNRDDRRVSVIT